jgi:mono/diheme cytochrome c family protein
MRIIFSIQLRDGGNQIYSFWKDELKDLRVEQATLMPSYRDRLSTQEIEDIVAYLAAQGGSR